ncbi:MAG: hypothetical protein Q9159_001480 [Coniocarpon cinnabarinum]
MSSASPTLPPLPLRPSSSKDMPEYHHELRSHALVLPDEIIERIIAHILSKELMLRSMAYNRYTLNLLDTSRTFRAITARLIRYYSISATRNRVAAFKKVFKHGEACYLWRWDHEEFGCEALGADFTGCECTDVEVAHSVAARRVWTIVVNRLADCRTMIDVADEIGDRSVTEEVERRAWANYDEETGMSEAEITEILLEDVKMEESEPDTTLAIRGR